jgi:hypothetical protein
VVAQLLVPPLTGERRLVILLLRPGCDDGGGRGTTADNAAAGSAASGTAMVSEPGRSRSPACLPPRLWFAGPGGTRGRFGTKTAERLGRAKVQSLWQFFSPERKTFSSFALATRSQAGSGQAAGCCCGGRGAMMPLPPLLAGPQPMATRFKLLLYATRLLASLMQATTTGAPPQNTALPPPTPPTPRQQQRHCPCLTWGCQPACPCACPCPCADQSLCDPLSSAEPKARREVFAYHAHLYNETGDAGHPRESSSGAAVCLSLAATICEEDDALAIADATPTCAPAPPTPPLPLPFQP